MDEKDDSAPDPWAGIDEEGAGQSAEDFTFSFDASSEPADPPAMPAADGETPAEFAADAPILPLESADTPADVDPFAALSIDADDGADDIAAWLTDPHPEAGGEPPLAVFPPLDAEPLDSSIAPEEIEATTAFEPLGSDDLHDPADRIGALSGSSHVEVGTGFSGVISPSEIDPVSGVSAEQVWPDTDSPDPTAESALDVFATDDQPSFEASGFEALSDVGEAGGTPESQPLGDGHGAVAAGAAAAATMTAAQPKARQRRRGGGLGQLIGVVLGGVMAIPITYAILLWGFQRDPFKLAELVPEQVAFLLPQKFQPGFGTSAVPKLDAASALDDLPAVADVPEAGAVLEPEPEPVPDPEPVVAETPATAAVDAVADAAPAADKPADMPEDTLFEPQDPPPPATPSPAVDDLAAAPHLAVAPQPAPPEPEPLDLTAFEAAVDEASVAFEALSAADVESPDRRRLLVAWYKRLAAAAEQFALLERIAAESGRGLGAASAAIDRLSATLAADAAVQQDLATLGGMWLGSKKRSADGTVLVAVFEAARRVGPYWSVRVTIDGAEPQSVAVISRAEPMAEPGERVLITGVILDGDVVWASDCRSLAPKAAPAEDLF